MSDEICRKPFVPRNRASLTGTAFDFIRVDIACAQCSKKSPQPLAELIANDTTTCSYCGAVIDISDETSQSELLALADVYKEIKPTR